MSADLYDVHVTLASLANVPPRGERAARENAAAAFLPTPSDFVIFTEAWHVSTRRGLFRQAPGDFRWVKPIRNSAVLAYRATEWRLVRKGSLLLHGVVAGSFGLVSDPRRMPWGVFEHRETGRRLVVGAVHLAPKGSRKGPAAVAASARAHERAFSRLDAFVQRFDYPVLLGGDWNDESPEVYASWSRGVGIDRVVMKHGRNAQLDGPRTEVSRYKLPASDHPGVRISVPVLKREAR